VISALPQAVYSSQATWALPQDPAEEGSLVAHSRLYRAWMMMPVHWQTVLECHLHPQQLAVLSPAGVS
jgi:hypothetical protein